MKVVAGAEWRGLRLLLLLLLVLVRDHHTRRLLMIGINCAASELLGVGQQLLFYLAWLSDALLLLLL